MAILPHPTTISRDIHKAADGLRNTLTEKLRAQFSSVGGAITLDVWTDKFRKQSYLGVTAHYVDDKFQLHDRILTTHFLDSEESKTGELLRTELFRILQQFNIFDFVEEIVFVTDRGPNVVTSLCGHSDSIALHIF